MKNFTNLILYSDYSVNIGYGTIDEYIKVCKEKNINTLALTDVNSMMGIFRFLNKCKANNIKSIIGVTLEIDKNNVTLLAKNLQGYHELCRILMLSTKNNYEEPFLRIDDIKETNNIVAILHTFEKEVSEEFINQIKLKIHDTYLEYTLLLGNRQHIRQSVVRLSESTNTPIVLCNPTFYSTQDNFDMCEMNMALSHNYQMSETPITRGGLRPALYSNEHYLKSTDEIYDYIEKNYQDVKKEIIDLAFENNSKIVDSIEQVELEYQLGLRPIPNIPAPYTDNLSYFKALIQEGWNKIVVGKPKQIQLEWKKRIQNELEVIHSNDFIDYFLVVREYIKWSEDNGYPTGTGRGSCGGSCIARLLDIHKTDPVRYDLMFDRFLSPGRSAIARITYNDNSFEEVPVSTIKNINNKDNYTYTIHVGDNVDNKIVTDYKIVDIGAAPDVDTDFIPSARSLVFKHCQEVYGENNITHIITRMPYKPRNAFKAICRISGVSPQEANTISESLPDSTSKDTLLNVLDEKNDEYKAVRLQLNGKLLDLMKKASRLEGRTSGTGVHACGVLISSKEICDIVPTAYKKNPHQDEDENEIFVKDENEVYQVSMFEYPEAESLGLIKMDFLGLDTLSLINDTVKLIKQYMNEDINMQDIIDGNLDDADTYKIFQKGETNGIFQFTEQGVQEMLKKVQPSEFEELPAITAIYRPGPMSLGLHDDFAIRKHDESKRIPFSKEFINTPIDELTKNTFGAIVYQEQVMKIAQEAAGFTSKEADKMRKAMGKKKVEILNMLEPKFKNGIIEKTHCSEDIINEFWSQLLGFAQYGFNKSHAVSYALNSYQSAYLKVHYPVMWSTAALRMYANNNKKFPKYVADVEAMGIKVLPPNINESDLLISPTSDLSGITYSISNIKSISTAVLESFVLERHKNGQYKDITDFINRNRDNLTATTLKALACSGCLDCFGNTRKSIYENAEALIKGSSKKKSNVISMFNMVDDVDDVGVKLDNKEWPISIKMANEGKALGTYLSGNPLDGLKSQDGQDIIQTKHLKNCDTTQYITFLDVSQKKTKSGNTVIIGTADNKASRMEIRLPSKITDRIMLGIALDKSNGDRNEAYRIMKLSSDKIAQFNKLEPLEKPVKFKQIYKLTYKKAYKGRVMIDNIEPVIVSENNQILQEIIVPKNKTQNLNQFMKLLEQETKQANLSNMKLTDILIKYYSEKEQDWKTREINQVYVSPSSIRLIQ
jgi:DNA polymerase-3 subunit alpha